VEKKLYTKKAHTYRSSEHPCPLRSGVAALSDSFVEGSFTFELGIGNTAV
jgi:hypothetical protein